MNFGETINMNVLSSVDMNLSTHTQCYHQQISITSQATHRAVLIRTSFCSCQPFFLNQNKKGQQIACTNPSMCVTIYFCLNFYRSSKCLFLFIWPNRYFHIFSRSLHNVIFSRQHYDDKYLQIWFYKEIDELSYHGNKPYTP